MPGFNSPHQRAHQSAMNQHQRAHRSAVNQHLARSRQFSSQVASTNAATARRNADFNRRASENNARVNASTSRRNAEISRANAQRVTRNAKAARMQDGLRGGTGRGSVQHPVNTRPRRSTSRSRSAPNGRSRLDRTLAAVRTGVWLVIAAVVILLAVTSESGQAFIDDIAGDRGQSVVDDVAGWGQSVLDEQIKPAFESD